MRENEREMSSATAKWPVVSKQYGAGHTLDVASRRMRVTGVLAAAAAALAGSWLSGSLRAQETAASGSRFPVGVVVPSVKSSADTSERYALYLPSHYDVSRRWPALLVLDPRGRAVLAMERFREAAERDGYIVVSSYNTVSDSTEEPNVRAVNAMLADLQSGFATDTRRVYLAGMSGTARLAWTFAYQLSGNVAGILGFAAGLPWTGIEAYLRLRQPASFVYFGGAGTGDFNFDEVRGLEHRLDSLGVLPHRAEYFEGQHGWPPASVCGDGLDWMELQAMKRGQRRRDDSLAGAWFTQRMAQARAADDSGRPFDAVVQYRAIRDDFRGLAGTKAAEDRVAALERLPAVRDRERRDQALELAFESYTRDKFVPFIRNLQNAVPPSLESALHDLDIRNLLRQQRDSVRDRLGAQAASRMLALVSVNTAFYESRRYFSQGDPAGALAMLAIAHEIVPASPYICFQQAKAYAEMGRTADVLESLRCAKSGGTLTVADLRDEHAFDRLRSDSAFAALAATFPPAAAPGTDN
jgi:dienelactone hydrolase